MHLEELVLHNFGVYRGRQTISLTPADEAHPVILIGGLNGEGKTTLLDALKLVLYGNRARVSNRNGLSYEAYLRHGIHRGVSPKEGAGLELQFRATVEGESQVFRIHRTWSAPKQTVREQVTVMRNGSLDRLLTETWSEYVEDLFPLEMSQLFFFDGERIERLASSELSGDLIRTAVNSLLGIDLIERLASDLVTLERKKKVAVRSEEDRSTIDELEKELEKAVNSKQALLQERAASRVELDRLRLRLEEATNRYRREGGELFEERQGLDSQRLSILERIRDVEERLRALAAGSLPLSHVLDLMVGLQQQGVAESNAEQAAAIAVVLEERDRDVISRLENIVPSEVVDSLEKRLADDRRTRTEAVNAPAYLGATSEALLRVGWLLDSGLVETQVTARERLIELDQLRNELTLVDRKLAAIPQPESIKGLAAEREQAAQAVGEAEVKLAILEELVERARRTVERQEAALVREIEKQVGSDFETEANSRVLLHSGRVRETLSTFRTVLTERHAAGIEAAIAGAFQRLLRKQTLVSGVRLDRQSFSLELIGADGDTISADRLSAGERQLLAVATLWGLAKVSGKSLPTVIDTPLGRLDSSHRRHLVERYFPNASHQVVLLSTDEEIDRRYLALLESSVSHEYRLEHDDATQTTTVKSGYFWGKELVDAN